MWETGKESLKGISEGVTIKFVCSGHRATTDIEEVVAEGKYPRKTWFDRSIV